MKNVLQKIAFIALSVVLTGMLSSRALAASNSSLTQTINPGTLTTDITDASRVSIASPTLAMTTSNVGFTCSTTTGTLGSNTSRLYISNASNASGGWTLTASATSGTTSLWTDQTYGTSYDFNDAASAGCSDGTDADTAGGQLRIDPSVGTITTDCQSCTMTGISKGSSAAFAEGTTDSITLINAGASSDDIWRGYLTGVGLTQSIPANTDWGHYSFGLTLTATAQ